MACPRRNDSADVIYRNAQPPGLLELPVSPDCGQHRQDLEREKGAGREPADHWGCDALHDFSARSFCPEQRQKGRRHRSDCHDFGAQAADGAFGVGGDDIFSAAQAPLREATIERFINVDDHHHTCLYCQAGHREQAHPDRRRVRVTQPKQGPEATDEREGHRGEDDQGLGQIAELKVQQRKHGERDDRNYPAQSLCPSDDQSISTDPLNSLARSEVLRTLTSRSWPAGPLRLKSCASRTRRRRPWVSSCPISPSLISTPAVALTTTGSTWWVANAPGSGTNSSHVSSPDGSNAALRVPGKPIATDRSAVPKAASLAESAAEMRMPIGVRIPVAIMSIRARAGAVHALAHPGSRAARSSFSISSEVFIGVSSGQTRRSARRRNGGAHLEYQRCRGSVLHSARGRRRIVVSAIENGAGSVAVSARPTFPNTDATSVDLAKARSCRRTCAPPSSIGAPGSVVGMNNRSPSSMRGRNSPPRRSAIGTQDTSSRVAISSVSIGRERAKWTKGR